MKIKITALILAAAFSLSCGDDQKREKRDFVPIEPKNKVASDGTAKYFTNDVQKSGNIELPTKDLTYFGPDGSLFPMVEFPTEPKIEFSE